LGSWDQDDSGFIPAKKNKDARIQGGGETHRQGGVNPAPRQEKARWRLKVAATNSVNHRVAEKQKGMRRNASLPATTIELLKTIR
jgi:hypothetical protein